MRVLSCVVAFAAFAVAGSAPSAALAADPATASTTDTSGGAAARVPTDDPTGGAYTSPTLLFIPAGALPVWNARVIGSVEAQGPYQSTSSPAPDAGLRPGAGLELGLPLGFTVAAGTNWVGGDVNAQNQTDVSLGLSPYFQARYHLFGDASGRGFQLGTAVTYKFVGFAGDPGEMELSLSAQYRAQRAEVGLQGVVGKDFATSDSDGEVHAYALYRVIPVLGFGGAAQVRKGLVLQPAEISYDVITGGIGSLTLGRFQVGTLVGATTRGLDQGHFGALGQLFASVRF